MSVKSTHYARREDAIATIKGMLDGMTNNALEDVLEAVLDADAGGECYMNFYVVNEFQDSMNPRWRSSMRSDEPQE